MLQEKMTLPVGATVQDTYGTRYRVEKLLGKGGFGAVYLVSDRHSKQHEFALKEVIEPSGEDHERLLLECEILKRLDHPALPHVYHVFEYEKLSRVYLLMAYIKGRNLEDLREEQPGKRFPLAVALAIIAPIVDALIYLHQQEPPIVHRDIKPDNIIVPMDGGEAVLVDFGTAKEYFQDRTRTTTVFRHGSPGYMPVEQYSPGGRTNLRTDVYGLGATLYALLTGVTPIDAIVRVMGENGGDPLKPVSAFVPDIPPGVSDAIQCALAIQNHNRFASVEAFWQALHSDSFVLPNSEPLSSSPETPLPPTFADETSSETLPSPYKQKSMSPRRKSKLRILALVCLLLLALGLGTWGISFAHPVATAVPRSAHKPTPAATASSAATSIAATSIYPTLALSYAGRIADSGVAGAVTDLHLTQIKQNQGHISGYFQGLYLVGPFTGTVSPSGVVNYTVKVASGVLIGKGNIKVGGEIVGTFTVVDQNGNSLGEYGIWSADPIAS